MEYDSIIKPPASERIKSGRVTLAAGESVGEHVTTNREELLVVLKGRATVTQEGEKTSVPAGSTHYIARERAHDVRNDSDEVLEYIYVVSLL